MSYTKQTWAVGDKITSAKLNHMEDGIGSAIKFIEIQNSNSNFYIEYSYNDIIGYITNETLVIITVPNPQGGTMLYFVRQCINTGSGYVVILDEQVQLQADTDTENMTVHVQSGGSSSDSGSSSDEGSPR